MKKRPFRASRFAAVDNRAIDSLPSLLAVGLLTRLIRAQDGDDVTVDSLAQDYAEGRKALEKAMRLLVHDGYVVRLKLQSSAGGARRGGTWRTVFAADSIPFTRDDVATLIAEESEGHTRAIRVEPAHLDPRPTAPKGLVGPTCKNTDSDHKTAGGTDKPLSDGRSTDRRSRGGSYKEEDCLSQTGKAATAPAGGAEGEERESSASRETPPPPTPPVEGVGDEGGGQPPDARERVVAAYAKALGRPLVNGTRRRLAAQAGELLTAGYPVAWLAARAAEMPARGWTDLTQHAERSRAPLPGQAHASDGMSSEAEAAAVAALRARIAKQGSGL